MTAPVDAKAIAAGLTKAQRDVVLWHPIPRQSVPHAWIAKRGMADLWRKGSAPAIGTRVYLREVGVLESKVSRGETLFRLTPLGLEVRAIIAKDAT